MAEYRVGGGVLVQDAQERLNRKRAAQAVPEKLVQVAFARSPSLDRQHLARIGERRLALFVESG